MVGIRQIAYVLNAKIKRRSVPLRICKAHYINVERVKKNQIFIFKECNDISETFLLYSGIFNARGKFYFESNDQMRKPGGTRTRPCHMVPFFNRGII